MPVPSPGVNGLGHGVDCQPSPCMETFQQSLRDLSVEYARLHSQKNMLEVENRRLQDLLTSAALDVQCELRDLDIPSSENGCMPSIKELASTDRYQATKPTHTINGQNGPADMHRRSDSVASSEPHLQSALSMLIPRNESMSSHKESRETKVRITTASVEGGTQSTGLQNRGLRDTMSAFEGTPREGTVSILSSTGFDRMSVRDPDHVRRGKSMTVTQNRQQLEDQFTRLVKSQNDGCEPNLSAWACWEVTKKFRGSMQFPDISHMQEALQLLASLAERSIAIAMSRDLATALAPDVHVPSLGHQESGQTTFESYQMELPHFLHLMQEVHFKETPSGGVWRTLAQLKMAFKQEAAAYALQRTNQTIEMRKDGVVDKPLPPGIALWLDLIPSLVIIINAVVIGITSDLDDAESFTWEMVEMAFVSFYLGEVLVKLYLLGRDTYFHGRERYWNYFDLFCLATSVADLTLSYTFDTSEDRKGGHRLIKMLRLGRVARLVRTLRFKLFHELKMMVYGVVSGVRVLFWAIVLLFGTVYFIGVIMQNLVGEDESEFHRVDSSMFTVFRCFTDGCTARDGTPLHERLRRDYGLQFFIGYILVFMFVTVGIFNLIMAIFIDNVLTSHMQRKQKELGENELKVKVQMEELLAEFLVDVHGPIKGMKPRSGISQKTGMGDAAKRVSQRVMEHVEGEMRVRTLEDRHGEAGRVLQQMHSDGLQVPKDIFNKWLDDAEMLQMLEDADIDTALKKEIFDALDVDAGGFLGIDELLGGLMKMRGPISKIDIVAARLKAGYIAERVDEIGDMITTLVQSLGIKTDQLPSQKFNV